MEENWRKGLKEGDKIAISNRVIGIVSRLTKTQIILKSGKKFRISNGKVIGDDWDTDYLTYANDERIIEIENAYKNAAIKRQLLSKIERFTVSELSIDKLSKILEIMKS